MAVTPVFGGGLLGDLVELAERLKEPVVFFATGFALAAVGLLRLLGSPVTVVAVRCARS